jgi:hypothetical protein
LQKSLKLTVKLLKLENKFEIDRKFYVKRPLFLEFEANTNT